MENLCELRHFPGQDGRCERCGVLLRELTSQEIYRIEKEKRGLRTQEYKRDGSRNRKHDTGSTKLSCPKCTCEVLTTVGRPKKFGTKKSRRVRCTNCGYHWRTTSKEAFGGFRNIEVRG